MESSEKTKKPKYGDAQIIADGLDLSESTVYKALDGRRNNKRVSMAAVVVESNRRILKNLLSKI